MAVKNAIKKGNAKIVIIATDIASSVMEEMETLLKSKDIPVYIWKDKIFLGAIIGKSKRGALAVLDMGFADTIEKLFSLNKGE